MKNIKKINFMIVIIITLQIIFTPIIVKASFFDDVIKQSDEFIEIGENNSAQTVNDNDIKEISDEIYVILLTIAIITAVIIGGILGIQFIITSAEEKAKVKEALIPYIVGCIVAFGAFGIWKAVILVLK